jgi:hypothetical protein
MIAEGGRLPAQNESSSDVERGGVVSIVIEEALQWSKIIAYEGLNLPGQNW